jgi:YjbE family integral membrane protein
MMEFAVASFGASISLAASSATGFPNPSEFWGLIVADLANITKPSAMWALLQVVMIDIVLAGDNAIVVGALAAGLSAKDRHRVIVIGILAALILRIIFALFVSQLLQIVGLLLAGGLLLLWVAWRMWRELQHTGESPGSAEIEGDEHSGVAQAKTFAGAAWSVALADVSMSLDNVLAVAGAARDHPGVMMIGLVLAVAMMGLAANVIAKYIDRYRWIAWVGLIVILWVAVKMIYEGSNELMPHVRAMMA